MISRKLHDKLKQMAKSFPILGVLGPRQSGKTTLVRHCFHDYDYVSLEDLDNRQFAMEDPRGFLSMHTQRSGLIIDEAQHAPDLLSYVQTESDLRNRPGQFILTGSQNFSLHEKINQSLAGRIALLTLLPLSLSELMASEKAISMSSYDHLITTGGYPAIHAKHIAPTDWYPSYIRTYLERDVRQVKNITDLLVFQQFMKLCAGRTGQLINWSDLGRDCGISYNTAKAWVSLLAASYIVFLLPAYHHNISKRVIKSPKLYFFDTGVACSLLGIESIEQFNTHYLKGSLFENFMIADFIKQHYHQGRIPHAYFWRDKVGHEIDCIIEQGSQLTACEIKSGQTIQDSFFQGLRYWQHQWQQSADRSYLIYGGSAEQNRSHAKVRGWNKCADLFV